MGNIPKRIIIIILIASFSLLSSTDSHAFQIATSVTTGCHEEITLNAAAVAGWPSNHSPPEFSDTDRRVFNDLPFQTSVTIDNPWSLSLVIGVRNNDIRDHSPINIPELVHIHNDPEDQPAHCLRRPEDDGPAGDPSAIQACIAFIVEELELALGTTDEINMEQKEEVRVALAFRGTVSIKLQKYAFHLGRALHALQDAFTHIFRAPADGRIRHVTNWIDWARNPLWDIARDGHPHVGALDDCTRTNEASILRVQRATEASTALITAISDPTGGKTGRMERANIVLENAFIMESGCTFDNDYCGAQELFESDFGCLTSLGKIHWLTILFVLLFLAVRKKRRIALTIIFCLLTINDAHADDRKPTKKGIALFAGGGYALDQGALAFDIGARWMKWQHLGIGVTIEHNPWISFEGSRISMGALNIFGTLVIRYFRSNRVELRTTLHGGSSILLIDLVGVDRGSVGVYIGASFLGLAISLAKNINLIIEPSEFSMPIPLIVGFPFYYRQYRATMGIEF